MSRQTAIAKLRDVLLRRREAIRGALAGDLHLLQSRDQDGRDVVDYAADSAQDELSSQLVEVESRELGSIEDALQRIREGSFGDCEVCGKPIPVARLQAIPHTTMCINCARAEERRPRSADPSAEEASWS